MSNELLLCKHKHFKHQNTGECIMYPSIVEYMYNHGAHLSLNIVIVFYRITLKMALVHYVIIVYYHIVLIIRLFMYSTYLVSFSHKMSNELLLCKHRHFKHQNKSEAIIMVPTYP